MIEKRGLDLTLFEGNLSIPGRVESEDQGGEGVLAAIHEARINSHHRVHGQEVVQLLDSWIQFENSQNGV